jgi:hypothetical protein
VRNDPGRGPEILRKVRPRTHARPDTNIRCARVGSIPMGTQRRECSQIPANQKHMCSDSRFGFEMDSQVHRHEGGTISDQPYMVILRAYDL